MEICPLVNSVLLLNATRKGHPMNSSYLHRRAAGALRVGPIFVAASFILRCSEPSDDVRPLDSTQLSQNDGDVFGPPLNSIPEVNGGGPFAEPVLVCADDEAREANEEERPFGDAYYPIAVDAEIALFPELQKALGFSHLENCKQARAWSALRSAIVDGHPEKPIDLTPDAEEPASPAEAPPPIDLTRDADEQGESADVDKIYQGVWAPLDDSVVGLVRVGIDGGHGCSSVAIGPRLLLTAAHCVAANTTLCNSYQCNISELFELRRAAPFNPVTGNAYTSYGTRKVTTFKHEGWGGDGDRGDDIALLYLEDMAVTSVRPLDLALPLGWFYASGWGRTTSSGLNDSRVGLRVGHGDQKFDVDWWPTDFSFIEDSGDADVDVCKGDSGGPAYSSRGIVGLVHGHSGSNSNCRVNTGDPEWWTATWKKVPWIEDRIRAVHQCPLGGTPDCCYYDSSGTQKWCW
jgi:V8-like Glu-specific endopeptidase